MMLRNLVLACLIAASAAGGTVAQSSLPPVLYSRGSIGSQLYAELLASHNVERRRAGVAPLAWDPALVAGAEAYANELARLNLLRHSPKAVRRGIGENLWMGTRDYFRPAQMVGAWASERTMFRPGIFPAVSRTGNWADVGHYTQMIWRGTQRVGCAVAKSSRADVLVCRYWPSGNVDGRPVP